MLLDFIDKKIRKAFSDAAFEYDLLTSLHKEIGRELLKKVIEAPQNDAVLDIGMGTGWLTKKIQFYLPESRIVGIDFAEGMLQAAKESAEGFSMIQANAMNLPFKKESFDIITSNLSLQWVKLLEDTFRSVHQTLKKDGQFIATMFGHSTFCELFSSLEAGARKLNGMNGLKIERLKSLEQVKEALAACGFKEIELDYELIKVHFCDMYSLVKWIKDIGANALPKQMFIGKELLGLANSHYEEHYKDKFGIFATFEVIWAKAQK